MDCSPPVSSAHGILQARMLELVAMPFSRGSSSPRDGIWVFCIAGGLFTEPPVSKLIGYIIAQGREAILHHNYQFCSVAQLCLSLCDPTARQASLFITNSRSLLKLMSMDSVMPSNHLILCHPRLLLPSILPSIRVFSNESVLRIRWPKYWSFSFNISPSNEHPGLISFRIDWFDLLALVITISRV